MYGWTAIVVLCRAVGCCVLRAALWVLHVRLPVVSTAGVVMFKACCIRAFAGVMRSRCAISLLEPLLLAVGSGGVHQSQHVLWHSSCTYRHASTPRRVRLKYMACVWSCNESAQTAALLFLQCSSTATHDRGCLHVLGCFCMQCFHQKGKGDVLLPAAGGNGMVLLR
jgi:hypothetical protein